MIARLCTHISPEALSPPPVNSYKPRTTALRSTLFRLHYFHGNHLHMHAHAGSEFPPPASRPSLPSTGGREGSDVCLMILGSLVRLCFKRGSIRKAQRLMDSSLRSRWDEKAATELDCGPSFPSVMLYRSEKWGGTCRYRGGRRKPRWGTVSDSSLWASGDDFFVIWKLWGSSIWYVFNISLMSFWILHSLCNKSLLLFNLYVCSSVLENLNNQKYLKVLVSFDNTIFNH